MLWYRKLGPDVRALAVSDKTCVRSVVNGPREPINEASQSSQVIAGAGLEPTRPLQDPGF